MQFVPYYNGQTSYLKKTMVQCLIQATEHIECSNWEYVIWQRYSLLYEPKKICFTMEETYTSYCYSKEMTSSLPVSLFITKRSFHHTLMNNQLLVFHNLPLCTLQIRLAGLVIPCLTPDLAWHYRIDFPCADLSKQPLVLLILLSYCILFS